MIPPMLATKRSGDALFMVLLIHVLVFHGCKEKKRVPSRNQASEIVADAEASRAFRADAKKPDDPQSRLVKRIDALNPRLRKAIAFLDRRGSEPPGRGKGTARPDASTKDKKPDGGELGRALLSVVQEFPDSSEQLWEYYLKAAGFIDLYSELAGKVRVSEEHLAGLARGFNEMVLAHNTAVMGIRLRMPSVPRPDERGLDPSSFTHKTEKLKKRVTFLLWQAYREQGGLRQRSIRLDSKEPIRFRVGVLHLKQLVRRALDEMGATRCRADKETCSAMVERVKRFESNANRCLKIWNELSLAILERPPPSGETKRLVEELHKSVGSIAPQQVSPGRMKRSKGSKKME